jgi:hypothetical protein
MVFSAWARADVRRERIVVKQLEEILNRFKNDSSFEGREIKVAVIEGAGHTPTFHKLRDHLLKRKDNIELSRKFVPTAGLQSDNKISPALIFSYFYSSELLRRRKFFPKKKPPRELLEKIILHNYFDLLGIFPAPLATVDDITLARRKIDQLGSEKRRRVLKKIERLKKSYRDKALRESRVIISEFAAEHPRVFRTRKQTEEEITSLAAFRIMKKLESELPKILKEENISL